MSGDCHNWGDVTGIQSIEARDVNKHSIMYRIAPKTKNYSVTNVHSTEIEKPCPRST